MEWTFSWGWFFAGIAILIVSLLILKFHRLIADNLANGIQSYDKIKLVAVIGAIVGLIVMANLHTLIIYMILRIIMPNQFS
jgi:hypothetical protein